MTASDVLFALIVAELAVRLTGLVLRHRAGQAAATRKQAKEHTQ